MANHHFISYSRNDAEDFAIKLCDKLKSGPPSISAWLDQRELKPGIDDWDDQVVEAIRTCENLIFVMTRDSVESASICKNEWTRAKKYKKPIIPILLHEDAEIPFQLENRQYFDFSDDFDTALAKLRDHLGWLRSPEGKLQVLKDRLADANRDLQRTNDPKQQKRIQEDIDSLKKQISEQEQIIADPDGAAKRAQENIERGLERERKPEKPVAGISKTKFINPPPGIAPTYFQDRFIETELIRDFLKNDAQRLLTIAGRAGVGKTAMVCRLLKALESSRLPDDLGEMKVDGIVYLSEYGSRKFNFVNLFFDLCKLLPEDVAKKLDGVYKDAKAPTCEKTYALLRAFPKGRIVLLLDNFEYKIDSQTGDIKDAELDEALKAFLTCEQHAVKVIITTRMVPRNLLLVEPGRQQRLDLDEGLEHPFAENILKEMDKDGKVGLKDASEELLNEARERTNGFPRALEALFGILSADRGTSLQEILTDAEKLLPELVIEKLVGEAFSRLDSTAQMVIQALAVYDRPVTNSAVDFLLQPYLHSVDSLPVLSRLVNMHFVRKEGIRYYLHPVDRDYALSRIPEGEPADMHLENKVFSKYALLHRGAEFFKETRRPRQD
ncbi:MAG: TIR domain-containing protein [Planctomycetes bacterium]|nr:TIR domain-containing protein [Planctomycetota bacterium]